MRLPSPIICLITKRPRYVKYAGVFPDIFFISNLCAKRSAFVRQAARERRDFGGPQRPVKSGPNGGQAPRWKLYKSRENSQSCVFAEAAWVRSARGFHHRGNAAFVPC